MTARPPKWGLLSRRRFVQGTCNYLHKGGNTGLAETLVWIRATWDRPIRRVVHVGANAGQEGEIYAALGLPMVEWVEADPVVFKRLQERVRRFIGQTAILACVSNSDGERVQFHVTSNHGGSSSVLQPRREQFESEWPGITVERTIHLETVRMDTLVDRGVLTSGAGGFLNLDVQGHELAVLEGLGSRIREFDVVLAEVSFRSMYVGSALLHDIDRFATSKGFTRVRLGVGPVQGEAWYVRTSSGLFARAAMAGTAFGIEAMAQLGLLHAIRRVFRAVSHAKLGKGH